MAKNRIVNTRFWIDDYISRLDPVEKLLFLYFLTNPMTDICGIYEIPLKNIALDTGLDKEMVIKIIGRFEKSGKIFYEDGWVAIKNFKKYQLDNPKVLRGIELGMQKAPETLRNKVNNSLYIDNNSLSHSNSNLNSNPKSNETEQSSGNSKLVIELFKEINPSYKILFKRKPQHDSCNRLLEREGFERLQKVIEFLQSRHGDKFCPQISTPIQLEEKWGALEKYAHGLKKSLEINNNPKWKIWT